MTAAPRGAAPRRGREPPKSKTKSLCRQGLYRPNRDLTCTYASDAITKLKKQRTPLYRF
jgi:hypothetical protein